MGFEDLFESSRKHQDRYGKQNYHGDHNDHHSDNDHRKSYDPRHSYQGRVSHFDWMKALAKIRENKKLKVFVIGAAIVILAIAIFLVITLLPFLGKIFTFITQMDLKGLQEYITGLLDKLLKG
jgi:type IV secretory pathway component VirB8